jgi:hypothetical protein
MIETVCNTMHGRRPRSIASMCILMRTNALQHVGISWELYSVTVLKHCAGPRAIVGLVGRGVSGKVPGPAWMNWRDDKVVPSDGALAGPRLKRVHSPQCVDGAMTVQLGLMGAVS